MRMNLVHVFVASILLICFGIILSEGYVCSLEDGYNFKGTVIASHNAASAEECCNYCGANSKCSGYTFLKNTGGCALKRMMDPRLPVFDSNAVSGYRGLSSTFKYGKTQNGHVYESFKTESYQACAHACQMSIPCQGWTWQSYEGGVDGNLCELREKITRMSTSKSHVCGYYIEPGQPDAYELHIRNTCGWIESRSSIGSALASVYFRSSKECCSACARVDGCLSWTYNTTRVNGRMDRTCTLANSPKTDAFIGNIFSRSACGCRADMPTFRSAPPKRPSKKPKAKKSNNNNNNNKSSNKNNKNNKAKNNTNKSSGGNIRWRTNDKPSPRVLQMLNRISQLCGGLYVVCGTSCGGTGHASGDAADITLDTGQYAGCFQKMTKERYTSFVNTQGIYHPSGNGCCSDREHLHIHDTKRNLAWLVDYGTCPCSFRNV